MGRTSARGSRIISWDEIPTADFFVDAVYEGGNLGQGKAKEVISKLLPGLPNSRGFRYRGTYQTTPIVVLYTTGLEPSWPDELDPYRGTFVYYGDNRHPGKELHNTPGKGNEILKRAFAAAHSRNEKDRLESPIFLIFEKSGKGFDVKFLGLAVPGTKNLSPDSDLTAIWRVENGDRFQNYRAVFTILDPGTDDKHVDGDWLRESVKNGFTKLDDPRTPKSLKSWYKTGAYTPLISQQMVTGRTAIQQTPSTSIEKSLVSTIYEFCKDDPYTFEEIAAEFWRLQCLERTEIDTTRPYRDGGRDATGWVGIGPRDDMVKLFFSMEAKCYAPENGVGVKEIARLISRLRHREFGVLVTTSYLSPQAYEEIRADQHPIIIFSGSDIAKILYNHGITSKQDCTQWLNSIQIPQRFHNSKAKKNAI